MKRLHFAVTLPVLVLLALLGWSDSALAGVSGKISGTVTDAETGQPIAGATVRVLGTSLTTRTDDDGEYFIINVPVGKYDLRATHVGFESITKKEVRILLDLTTPVDFGITEVAVDIADSLVVYATAPIIQRDLTASRITFTAERLKNLPNIVTVQSVLSNYPGVVVDRDRELHVRGGRSGQVTYYYDGYSVQDPFVANSGIRIVPDALEELSLTSGGFTAEYGEAMSGVVNAVTPEGGSKYHGKLRAYEGFTQLYDVTSADWGGLERHDNRSLTFNLSGPIPGMDEKRYSFFTAGEYLRNNTYLPHNWEISYTGIAKLSMQPTSNLKLKTNFAYFTSDGDTYTHRDVNGRSYDFNLDGLPSFEQKAYLFGVSGNYYFNEHTIASASVNRFSTWTLQSPKHLMGLHWSEWPGYSEDANGVYNGDIHERNYGNDFDPADPYELLGFTNGDDFNPTYSWRETKYNAVSASLVKQLGSTHELKSGFEYRQYAIDKDFKQFFNDQPYSEDYDSDPVYASFFMQDKIEYADFVINAGLRYDYRNADIAYNITPGAVEPVFKEADGKSRLAPRLGVSFPVSTQTVLHFNYGIYYQMPRFQYLYFNPQGEVNSGLPLLGNPDLEPERTTSFELGMDHLIDERWRIDITAYYKDIADLVTTRSYVDATTTITRFTNEDYGSVKGVDLAIEKLPVNSYISGSISYSYMLAQGNGSNALEPYYNINSPDTVLPVTEYPLDFDQRHTLTTVVDWRLPPDWQGNLFGLTIPGDWGITAVGYFGSGLPYTKTSQDGTRLGERNEHRLPVFHNVDARFAKNFRFEDRQTLTFFIEVDNIFNRRNVIDLYTRSGLPDNDYDAPGGSLVLNQDELDEANRLYDHDPQHFSPPRAIRTGFELSF